MSASGVTVSPLNWVRTIFPDTDEAVVVRTSRVPSSLALPSAISTSFPPRVALLIRSRSVPSTTIASPAMSSVGVTFVTTGFTRVKATSASSPLAILSFTLPSVAAAGTVTEIIPSLNSNALTTPAEGNSTKLTTSKSFPETSRAAPAFTGNGAALRPVGTTISTVPALKVFPA